MSDKSKHIALIAKTSESSYVHQVRNKPNMFE